MDYPKPSITADVILHEYHSDEIPLVKRLNEPFKSCWALPGGFFEPLNDATIEDAAWREAREEIFFDINLHPEVIERGFFNYFDQKDRDPRGRTITMVFYAHVKGKPNLVARDDAEEVRWFSVHDLLTKTIPLAFDHQQIIEQFFAGH